MGGVVIYMSVGVDYFGKIELYLAKHLGLKSSEIASLGGGKIDKKKKEKIKQGFLKGDIKILIGSSTIKEGINLQDKATTLFNLTLDWNPTDIQQLEGRIYRQKNQHSHVRIVTPLIENSVDVFMFQKLEEKTGRINDIWFRADRTNVLDVDNFDPRELKLGLMTDPVERARAEISIDIKAVEIKVGVLDENIKELSEARRMIDEANSFTPRIDQWYEEAVKYLQMKLSTAQQSLSMDDYSRKADKEQDERMVASIPELLSRGEELPARYATIKKHARMRISYLGRSGTMSWVNRITQVDEQDKRIKSLERLQKNVLNQHDLIVSDDLTPLLEEYEAERRKLENHKMDLKSSAHFDVVVDKLKKERSTAEKESRSVAYRVEQFTKHNYLLSCLAKIHDCTIDDTVIRTKTQVIQMPAKAAAGGNLDLKRKRAKAFAFAQAQRIRIMNLKEAA
jgi:hypothetical protein